MADAPKFEGICITFSDGRQVSISDVLRPRRKQIAILEKRPETNEWAVMGYITTDYAASLICALMWDGDKPVHFIPNPAPIEECPPNDT